MSSRSTIRRVDSDTFRFSGKDSAHAFYDSDDRKEDLNEPHVHIEFTGADVMDLSTNRGKTSITVRITKALAELLGIVPVQTHQTIIVDDRRVIYIMADGSIFRSEDTEVEYTAPPHATEPSAGGIFISRYRMDSGKWEYHDRCPDQAALKDYVAMLARHRRVLK